MNRCKSRPFLNDKQPSEQSETPPCKRSLFDHSTTMKNDTDCDKYSFRSSNLKLPSEPLSLSLPSHILPTDRNIVLDINEKEQLNNRSIEGLSKNYNMKTFSQKEDIKGNTPMSSPLSGRGDALRNINHVSIHIFWRKNGVVYYSFILHII